jgi:hypothetical protein
VTDATIIALTETDGEAHLALSGESHEQLKIVCSGVSVGGEEVKFLPDTEPVESAISDLCDDCVEGWRELSQGQTVSRQSTVKCMCVQHRPTETLSQMTRTIPVTRARGLNHPNYETQIPVSKTCYRWIRGRDNEVETRYSEADPWLPD